MSKQSKTEQPSAKEALRLNWRAAKIWWELMPKALIYKAWGAFFEASAPYLSLWFSAQLLGEVAGACSDLVVLTEEDSGEEDTLSICREIASHVACECRIEPNRGEAIRQAVLSCREPSVLLITGKGAETRQKRGLEYIDTPSDVDYVRAFLQEYDARRGR